MTRRFPNPSTCGMQHARFLVGYCHHATKDKSDLVFHSRRHGQSSTPCLPRLHEVNRKHFARWRPSQSTPGRGSRLAAENLGAMAHLVRRLRSGSRIGACCRGSSMEPMT